MKNLISMTDFVLNQEIKIEVQSLTDQWSSRVSRYNKIMSYAKFLKQPLELWMFVPCVDNEVFNYSKHGNKEQYEQAKERCLFEGGIWDERGFVKINDFMFDDETMINTTIEDIIYSELELSKSALNKIGL